MKNGKKPFRPHWGPFKPSNEMAPNVGAKMESFNEFSLDRVHGLHRPWPAPLWWLS